MDLRTDLVFDETGILHYWDCSLDRIQFCKFLGFAVKENRLVSVGKCLVLMGKFLMCSYAIPLWAVHANIFMRDLEKRYLGNFQN